MVLDDHIQHSQPKRFDTLGGGLSFVLYLVVNLLRYPRAVSSGDRPFPNVIQLSPCGGLVRVKIVHAVDDLVNCDRAQPEPDMLAQDHEILV